MGAGRLALERRFECREKRSVAEDATHFDGVGIENLTLCIEDAVPEPRPHTRTELLTPAHAARPLRGCGDVTSESRGAVT